MRNQQKCLFPFFYICDSPKYIIYSNVNHNELHLRTKTLTWEVILQLQARGSTGKMGLDS